MGSQGSVGAGPGGRGQQTWTLLHFSLVGGREGPTLKGSTPTPTQPWREMTAGPEQLGRAWAGPCSQPSLACEGCLLWVIQ